MPPGFEPWFGSVRPKQPSHSPDAKFRQVFFTLFFRAELIDRIHDQRALYRGGRTHARIATFNFLHNQAISDIVHAAAAVVSGMVGPKAPTSPNLLYDFIWEVCVLAPILNVRGYFALYKVADGAAYQLMFIGKQIVNRIKIRRLKLVRAVSFLDVSCVFCRVG